MFAHVFVCAFMILKTLLLFLFYFLHVCSYHVNRDTLFSYHKASEEFLHRLMSLYVSSHYKNTPNDLQLLSDSPAHRVFVLLGPIPPEAASTLPEILCVLQVTDQLRQTLIQSFFYFLLDFLQVVYCPVFHCIYI